MNILLISSPSYYYYDITFIYRITSTFYLSTIPEDFDWLFVVGRNNTTESEWLPWVYGEVCCFHDDQWCSIVHDLHDDRGRTRSLSFHHCHIPDISYKEQIHVSLRLSAFSSNINWWKQIGKLLIILYTRIVYLSDYAIHKNNYS